MMVRNERYAITGMSCAACSARVEKAVSSLKGIKSVSVNLLTNAMQIDRDESLSSEEVCKAVEKAGYGARLSSQKDSPKSKAEKSEVSRGLLLRLITSCVLVIPLFYMGMGHMMGWPLGEIGANPFFPALITMFLSLAIIAINFGIFKSGFRGVLHRSPNMDTLVALGSSVSFIYSTVLLFLMAASLDTGSLADAHRLSMSISYETAGMVPTFITIGKTLESYSKGKTTSALSELMDLAPKTATVIVDGQELVVPIEAMKAGDVFLVRPGESFPADGTVLEGEGSVDESFLTGESLPVDKHQGSSVSQATINLSGAYRCRADKIGRDTALSKIIETVQNASGGKAKISTLADKVSGIFVPLVLLISLIVFACWMLFGGGFVEAHLGNEVSLLSYSLERAVSVLVISCPCALGLATPVAIMVGSGKGAKNGILFKTASSLEETGKAKFAVFDKTGTITEGKPSVQEIIPSSDSTQEELLRTAKSLECWSEHPYAKAIMEEGGDFVRAASFESLTGSGVKGILEGQTVIAGKGSLLSISIEKNLEAISESLQNRGKTVVHVQFGTRYLGMIALGDRIKEDSKEAISSLVELGITPIMLTGDNEGTAKFIAEQAGIVHFRASLLPNEKQMIIKELKCQGKVIMVGDGINDAPALVEADIGLAIGAGTDIAMDSADVVLITPSLSGAVRAIRLSKRTLLNIKENLFWAFFYNLVMIPFAAGAIVGLGLYRMPPWVGAAAMSLSSVTVVLNALRLNLYDPGKKGHGKKKATEPAIADFANMEETHMKRELAIEGMMCMHCVAHVKAALEAVKGVESAEVSLEEKKAIVSGNADEAALVEALTKAGYKALGVRDL